MKFFLPADEIFVGFQPADTDGLGTECHGGQESVKWREIILSRRKKSATEIGGWSAKKCP